MRKPALVCLLSAAFAVAIWAFASSAQDLDPTRCQQQCRDQHSECLTACGSQDDPAECESSCDDQLENCLEQCG